MLAPPPRPQRLPPLLSGTPGRGHCRAPRGHRAGVGGGAGQAPHGHPAATAAPRPRAVAGKARCQSGVPGGALTANGQRGRWDFLCRLLRQARLFLSNRRWGGGAGRGGGDGGEAAPGAPLFPSPCCVWGRLLSPSLSRGAEGGGPV